MVPRRARKKHIKETEEKIDCDVSLEMATKIVLSTWYMLLQQLLNVNVSSSLTAICVPLDSCFSAHIPVSFRSTPFVTCLSV